MDAFGVPSFPQSVPSPPGEIGRYYHLAPSVEIINSGFVWHSDKETPETISTTGLAAVTRTYAKIIADTNSVDLQELRSSLNR
jgi:F0F1-type ATP synthase epsilon subunit